MYKVILADNQSVFRTGVARILATEEDFRIVGQCDDAVRLIKAAKATVSALIVFAATLQVDLGELIETSGDSGGRTIAILENDSDANPFLQAGVRAILHRDTSNAELVTCLRAVGRGERYIQQRATDSGASETMMVAERVRERLTPKELKIVGLILKGYKNREMATELNNSEQVIKNYLRSIFDKTGVADRLELALFAMHHKLLHVPAGPQSAPSSRGDRKL